MMEKTRAIKKITSRLRHLKQDPAIQRFILHNKRLFLFRKSKSEKSVVLFELNNLYSAHIAYSYLANVLSKRYDAAIKSFIPNLHNTLTARLVSLFDHLLGINKYKIYKSFGSSGLVTPVLSNNQIKKSKKIFIETFQKIKTKSDIESMTINGIWIGDLIYDSFLMKYKKPTIIKESQEFKNFLLDSIQLFVFWVDYINTNDVKAIHVSHCVYNTAILLRIGVKNGIPVFQVTLPHVYRMSSQNMFAYNDFFHFREKFASLPVQVQEAGLKEAEFRIKRRFSGEVGVDMGYSTKSAYGKFKDHRLLKASLKKKVLIATHCFFDSPHSYGNNLFPDFYEWLDFLGQMTSLTDYDWYIKTHPDYLPKTKEIIDYFIEKYPRFTLLPPDSSHHQIIAEGIDVALTVYGTIGFEYAALGVPVINASLNNPHIAYEFNLHPKNIDEYRAMLMNINELNFKIDKRQVYEYYFMKHIYHTENLFLDDYHRTIREIGGYHNQFTSTIYENWLNEWTNQKHNKIILGLEKFIESGDFRMEYRHMDQELLNSTRSIDL